MNNAVNGRDYLGFTDFSVWARIREQLPRIKTGTGIGVSYAGEATAGGGIFSVHGELSATALIFLKYDNTDFNAPLLSVDGGLVFSGAGSFGPLGILSTDKFAGDGAGLGPNMSDGFNPALGLSSGYGASFVSTDAADSQEYADLSQSYYINAPVSVTYQEGNGHSAYSIGTGDPSASIGRQRSTSYTFTQLKNLLVPGPGGGANSNANGNVYKTPNSDALQLPPVIVKPNGVMTDLQQGHGNQAVEQGGVSQTSVGQGGVSQTSARHTASASDLQAWAGLASSINTLKGQVQYAGGSTLMDILMQKN